MLVWCIIYNRLTIDKSATRGGMRLNLLYSHIIYSRVHDLFDIGGRIAEFIAITVARESNSVFSVHAEVKTIFGDRL